MTNQINEEDYLWIIVDDPKKVSEEETFLGLSDDEGRQFIPVTRERAEGEVLMKMLPPPVEAVRTVEAIHREQLLTEAQEQNFSVYIVDSQGKVLEQLV